MLQVPNAFSRRFELSHGGLSPFDRHLVLLFLSQQDSANKKAS
uniref:Uncharacterized protein n=1 Tax=Rhizophora mucronata TaxID=61149 RepID=A0A2P2IYF4_RHIMU